MRKGWLLALAAALPAWTQAGDPASGPGSDIQAPAASADEPLQALTAESPAEPAPPAKIEPKAEKKRKKELIKKYSAAVESHIEAESEEAGGGFPVHDHEGRKDWSLVLDHIHKNKIVELGDDTFFACADFDEEEGKQKLDLDFYVKKEGNGWKVTEVLVHKVDGRPRYTYNDANERVPVPPKKQEKK